MLLDSLTVDSLFTVQGKVALVTGGATGIGVMIASTLVQNGAKVYISSRKESALKAAAKEMNAKGSGTCEFVAGDLGSRSGCDAVAEYIKSREPRLHILVNNSGATWSGSWDDFPESSGWNKIMNLNVKAIFYLTAALSPLLTKDTSNLDPGRVINISSVASLDAKAEMAGVAGEGMGTWSYGVSKAAVNHLSSIQAVKLGPQNVTVNAILPGLFSTPMTRLGMELYGDEMREAQPTGRIGLPSDIGGMVLFLASPAGAHVTGAHIQLDGGANIANRGGFTAPGSKL